ncbi:MAG TPA: sugar phosphate isomerase/epimerase family protein [Kribbella sp.]|uniref:sugar phosphate isomerase/epimerase family protein n=1 Tax=Kribbella sp. TaxID=1871183 RepID=UPI002D769813|nr:sugar phosphate isomerase/epimerase family protein [Kribbella sp.]HET6294750.1 sugar phosphate isomerase/epimerase family protein [Kribbella sp.]
MTTRTAAKIGLSTASVYPESTASAFELSARLGYDGVEVMVGIDPLSTQIDAVKRLIDYHQLPVLAIHAPCLLITQRVWGTDPWGKLERSAEAAKDLGADVVVVHPPFRWQRDYARGFVEGIARLEDETGVIFAVENMYPWRAPGKGLQAYAPSWDPTEQSYAHTTLDLSHSSTAEQDCVELAATMGATLKHVHLTDGTGSAKDEHLVPGRGTQRAADLLNGLANNDFRGHIIIEINTRRASSRSEREVDLIESLDFTRKHFVRSADVVHSRRSAFAVTSDGEVSELDP